jgi:protein CpxP
MIKLGQIKTLTIASLSALALAGSVALAQNVSNDQNKNQTGTEKHEGWGRGERREGGERLGRGGREGFGMFQGITLTDDQKTQMKQLHESFNSRTQSLRQELRAKHQEIRQSTAGGTFDEALVTQKLQEAAGLEAKMMGEEFKLHQQMQSILTPEQKTQLEQKRAEFKAKMGQRGERKPQ